MEAKICPFCGGKIPKEKIKEFQSKFRAEESKMKKQIEEDYEKKIKDEKKRAKQALKQQKELFEDFKKTLKEEYDDLLKKKTKTKDEELESMKKKLEEAENEKKKIEQKIEKDYEEKMKELEEGKNKEILKLKQKETEERAKLISEHETKIRQIESKRPTELGTEGQAEVIDILLRIFQRDDIKETKRGKAGSDIFHRIRHNGEMAGLIVYEVKNVSSWNNKFIEQVKSQKTRHSANYAILVTNVFPSRERVISEKDGILIVHPTKVGIIARQIRDFLIETYKAKLSGEEIEEKIKALQEFLTSTDYKNALSELLFAIKNWQDLRYKERIGHERHWAEEEQLNKKIQVKTATIHAKIASIVESRLQKIPAVVIKKKKKSRG